MHPEHDVIRAFAGLVAEHARERGIPNERILVYGSSLGGFGAIGLAAHLPGARAVAEVPQIEFTHWMPLAVTFVEEELTGPIEDHRAKHPEQVSLSARIRTAGHVPQATIFPNPEDLSFEDQQEFVAWANDTDRPRHHDPRRPRPPAGPPDLNSLIHPAESPPCPPCRALLVP